MQTKIVLVADGGRARLFTVAETVDQDFERGPRLVEQRDLVNPESSLSGKEVFDNNKSGRNRAPGGGGAHGYDDHREGYRRESHKRFAKDVAQATAALVESEGNATLVVVAEPRFLGALRGPLAQAMGDGSPHTIELGEDLSWRSPAHIRKVLEHHGLVPEERMPEATARRLGISG